MNNEFISQFEELRKIKPKTLRSRVRDLALTGLSMTASEKYLNKPRVQFLYIHHIFQDEEKRLEALLQKLSKQHTFISYSDAVEKIRTRTIDKPYITFSSDDGLKNNLRGAEIMNKYNAKACFFINPGIIGETNYAKLQQFCNGTLDFPTAEFLNWDDVGQLQKMGHEIGSHTMMHMNIAATNADLVASDLTQTYKILSEKCGPTKHFAFPYGRFFHFSSEGKKAVFNAGFATCASAERGCHVNPDSVVKLNDLCIRRDHTVLGWDLKHIMYFLINNAKNASVNNNFFPDNLK